MLTNRTKNLLYWFSITVFVVSLGSHLALRDAIANKVEALGMSTGGRITTVYMNTCSPTPVVNPPISPCTCSTYTTIITPMGTMYAQICPPLVNTPITGIPITMSSIGYAVLGNWTVLYPLATSMNWGTSMMPL